MHVRGMAEGNSPFVNIYNAPASKTARNTSTETTYAVERKRVKTNSLRACFPTV